MARQPHLRDVYLGRCCIETLDEIRWVTKGIKWIQIGLMPAVFLSLFLGPDARGGSIGTIIFIAQQDWVGLARVTKDIPLLKREICTKKAHEHALSHSGSKLEDFWVAIGDSF